MGRGLVARWQNTGFRGRRRDGSHVARGRYERSGSAGAPVAFGPFQNQDAAGVQVSISGGAEDIDLLSTSIESLIVDAGDGADTIEVHDLIGSSVDDLILDLGLSSETVTVTETVLDENGDPMMVQSLIPLTDKYGNYVDYDGNPIPEGEDPVLIAEWDGDEPVMVPQTVSYEERAMPTRNFKKGSGLQNSILPQITSSGMAASSPRKN